MDALTVVTGGASFIGSHLVDRLVARGERVRVIERDEAAVSHLPDCVEVVHADIRTDRRFARPCRGRPGSTTSRRIRTSGSVIAPSSRRSITKGRSMCSTPLGSGCRPHSAYQHREHSDPCSTGGTNRGGC